MRIKICTRRSSIPQNSKKGFTLVEMLISIVLMLIVTTTVGKIFSVYLAHYEQATEITTARQRGEMVLSILEGPILHAGMGMPNDKNDFVKAFEDKSNPFKDWEGPIYVEDKGVYGDKIRIAYAMPTDVIVKNVDESTGDITFNSRVDKKKFSRGNGSKLKNWAIFPSVEVPFRIIYDDNPDELTLSEKNQEKLRQIAIYDNLCALRGVEAYVDDKDGLPVFYFDYGVGSGKHPRVKGIGALHFDWESDQSLVTVSILALGSQRHSEKITTGDVPLWDEDKWGWKEEYRHYRLAVVNGSWRVRN